MEKNKTYWNAITAEYHDTTRISTNDFHYGPLVPGDSSLKLLPSGLSGKTCLEIGCGAAQNSIFLSKQGAECTAFDISDEQIKFAEVLMKREGVDIDLKCTSMDSPIGISGKFDFIHSVYAISFSNNPGAVAKFAARHLNDDGYFLLSTWHPLSQCEWLDIEGEQGIFMPDYFSPPPDIRYDDNGKKAIESKNCSLSTVASWITDAGMCIERIVEPKVNIPEIKDAPYYSEKWSEYATMFTHVPAVVIFLCRKQT